MRFPTSSTRLVLRNGFALTVLIEKNRLFQTKTVMGGIRKDSL